MWRRSSAVATKSDATAVRMATSRFVTPALRGRDVFGRKRAVLEVDCLGLIVLL